MPPQQAAQSDNSEGMSKAQANQLIAMMGRRSTPENFVAPQYKPTKCIDAARRWDRSEFSVGS